MRTYRLRHPSGPSLDIHAEHVSRAMEVFLSAYPHLDEDGTTASIILKSGLEVDWDTGEVTPPPSQFTATCSTTTRKFDHFTNAIGWISKFAGKMGYTWANWPGASVYDHSTDDYFIVSHDGDVVLMPPAQDAHTW